MTAIGGGLASKASELAMYAALDALHKRRRLYNGVRIHPCGYLQLTRGIHRFKLVHRAVMEAMLMSPIGLLFFAHPGRIPDGMHVHHQDWNKRHNCQGNLLLLDSAIHNWLSNRQKEIRRTGVWNWP